MAYLPRLRQLQLVRVLAYLWAAPATLIGLALASLDRAAGGRVALHSGVVEAEGPLLAWGLTHLCPLGQGAAAITFGHVVLAVDAAALEHSRSHERVHVGQYDLLGPLFIPISLAASAWAAARGGHAYYDNRFEREARDP
jgi:hypothetical protein